MIPLVGFGNLNQFYFWFLAHAQHSLHLRFAHRVQARRLDILHRVELDGTALELFFFVWLLIFIDLEGVSKERLIGVPGGMRDLEDLFGALSKLVDLTFDTHFFNGVLDALDIDHALVGKGVEQIISLNGFLASLLVPEDKIDPFMQIFRDIVWLEGLSIHFEKDIWVSVGPEGNPNITYLLFVLSDSQIEILIVFEEGAIIHKELRDEFLEGGGIFHDVIPVIFDAFEEAIRFVKSAALQLQHVLRFLADQVADDIAGGRVVTSIHEFRVFHVFVPFEETLKTILVESSDRSAQISVDLGITEIYLIIDVVRDDPGEDGVLRQIRNRTIAGLIDVHKILKIADLSGLPL
jgi:hypothetical protein